MQPISWLPFSILATTLLGVSLAFYKFPTAKKLDRFSVAFWSLLVSALLALSFFFSYLSLTTTAMVWTAVLWGITFPAIMLLQMYALEHTDTNILFPVTSTTSLVLTVLIGIVAFREYLTELQILGVALAVISVFLFSHKDGKLQFAPIVAWVGSGIVLLSVFNKVLQKIVANGFDIHAFQIYQYLFATLVVFIVFLFVHRKNKNSQIGMLSAGARVGISIGLFGFFGGYALLLALTKGPLSLITSIHSLYIFVTALTAYFFFKEKIAVRKVLLIILAILAVILIRIGG